MKTSGYLADVGVITGFIYLIYKNTAMIIFRTIKVVAYAGLVGFYSSVLVAGDLGVEGSVTATTFFGNGAGLTGVVTDGVEVGDMQYWDGAAWVLIPAPPAREVTLTSCKGVPRWSSTSCFYAIGDTGPAGGIVFYITDGGLHGLEAAPASRSIGAEWGCIGTDLPGAEGTAVGTGAQNTADILDGCSEELIAARVADVYHLNGYHDWFLPSKDELDLLYQQKDVVGGFTVYGHWSSSEFGSLYAWWQSFATGGQGNTFKYNSRRVRAVRAF